MSEPDWKIAVRARYADSLPGKVANLRMLFDGLMRSPADRDARQQLRQALHRIHGSAGSYDYADLGDLAGSCEELLIDADSSESLAAGTLAAMAHRLDEFERIAALARGDGSPETDG